MDKESSKNVINNLLNKYQNVVNENRINNYNEEMTKKDFILPLFRALGWNTEDSTEVTAEEKISKKRVDYGFRINVIPKFMLEAKKLKEDIINTKYVEQAIDYSWNKGCTWAVLTNFETIIIFNAEWKVESPWHNRYKTIESKEFLQRFDELWLLSRESFEQKLIDVEAEKVGKKGKKNKC
jgi:predicted type IV restriction endonuclease